MHRRRFLRRSGVAAVAAASALAGCSSDDDSGDGSDGDDGGGSDGSSTTETDEPTATAGAGELTITSVDTEDVDEHQTVLMEVTVANDDAGTRSGEVVGEIDLGDGGTFTKRRQVTLDGGESDDVGLKVTYESDQSIVTYSGDAAIENDQPGEPDDPLETDPADDLVVLEFDSDSADEPSTIAISARVSNLASAERSADLVGEVDLGDEGAFTDRTSVSIRGGLSSWQTVKVAYESESSFVSYSARAWVE